MSESYKQEKGSEKEFMEEDMWGDKHGISWKNIWED